MSYTLLDSGNGRKLEQFGDYVIDRPSAVAFWEPKKKRWNPDARFDREEGWQLHRSLPDQWTITIQGIIFRLQRTDFGHLGIFPEQYDQWEWIASRGAKKVLNLFAYSGGSSLFAAKSGAKVCHVDAAQGMVEWAKDNAELNNIDTIRWIVDDVRKFIKREIKRGNRYDGIILDPPSFGRGKSLEVFKIERDVLPLLKQCKELLSDAPKCFLLSCHTPGWTPCVLKRLMESLFDKKIEAGEMLLGGDLPSGAFARW